MLDEIVQVLVYILGVLLKAFKVFGAARAGAVVVYAATDSEILVFGTNNSPKGYGCDDCSWRVSKLV